MGRVFCLPIFSRRNKFKVEYQPGLSDDSYTATPVSRSPASHITAETESKSWPRNTPVDQEEVVKQVAKASGMEQELSSSSCYEEHQEQAEAAEAVPINVVTSDVREESEAEILAGHLSDPGLYCVEDREFAESCATSECSQRRTNGDGSDVYHAPPQELREAFTSGEEHDAPREPTTVSAEEYGVLRESVDGVSREGILGEGGAESDISCHGFLGEAFAAEEGGEVAGVTSEVEKVSVFTRDDDTSGMKRVAEWVKSIDNVTEPFVELSFVDAPPVEHGPEHRTPPAANKDLELVNAVARSLDFHSTVAHLSGLGLTLIPSLAAFSNLKTLKLSANSIVRITPGSLPKGLQTLDLSRNKISAIEGLRELTRLRSLNLSYNRISRIGQGLASCSSVRELYLAHNKISEVEGLHRLSKLALLDLSYNRLASTKSLGQIAATYTSLMAINLIGNPVTTNVGEEQLKRYITGVAPNLVYLNNQPIKGGALTRDAVVRSLIGNAASNRVSPKNPISSSSSKARRMLHSGTSSTNPSSSRRKDKKEASTHHLGESSGHRSSSKPPECDQFKVKERLLARIQRVKSDGALHDRDM